jgi:small subunit ribosomal protein S9
VTQRSNAQSISGQTYYYGTGKRKCAIAQVRLYPDGNTKAINGRPFESVLPLDLWQSVALEPLRLTDNLDRFSIIAKLHGGGISAWSQAIRHGIARALLVYDPNLRPTLKKLGMLTRDARVKESKKYGLKRARRAPQYTKR